MLTFKEYLSDEVNFNIRKEKALNIKKDMLTGKWTARYNNGRVLAATDDKTELVKDAKEKGFDVHNTKHWADTTVMKREQ